MQVVILAGGKGTRMGELSKTVPKPMLPYRGKNLIEHKLEALPDSIKEVVMIVGHLQNEICTYFGNTYTSKSTGRSIPITYIEQKELLGTAHALWQAKDILTGKFIVLNGDDLYGKEDLEALAQYDHAFLSYLGDPKRAGGKIILARDGSLENIIEDKNGDIDSPLVSTGACVLTTHIFSYPLKQIPGRSEFGLPQTVLQMLDDHKIHLVQAKYWKQITSPEDLK